MDTVKQQIRHAWDHGAESYDGRWGHGIKTPTEHLAWTALLRRLLPAKQARVLDVGCGPGVLSLLIAELGHQVTGLDISPRMLEVAARRAHERGMHLELVEGDAEAPDLPDGAFDVVITRHVLWTLPEPERAVRAWAALTLPGGSVIAIDGLWSAGGWATPVLTRVGRAVAAVRRSTPEGEHGYPAGTYDILPLRDLRATEPARNVFLRAGLTDVRAEELNSLDRIERRAMPVEERLQAHYRRYLVEGHRASGPASS